MAAIKGSGTKPERILRSLAHRLGYRFRLYRKDLPGKPDLVFPKYQSVILVHGCFWHVHDCRFGRVKPKTRAEFWEQKRLGNVKRDQRNINDLEQLGWRVLVIWECETRNPEFLERRIQNFLA